MMGMSERDRALLRMVSMTEEQAERNAAIAESSDQPDGLTGRVYYGLHFNEPGEEMVTVNLRLPKSTLERLDETARRQHISSSELMRRQIENTH